EFRIKYGVQAAQRRYSQEPSFLNSILLLKHYFASHLEMHWYGYMLWLLCVMDVVYCGAAKSCSSMTSRPWRKTHIGIVAGDPGRNSQFFCNGFQTEVIEQSISWANRYAAGAIFFLDEMNSGTTAAFIGWFGVSNIDKVEEIMHRIYCPIHGLGRESRKYAADRKDMYRTLVIGCDNNRQVMECLEPNVYFIANGKSNTIVACPRYFFHHGVVASRNKEIKSKVLWNSQRQHLDTAGFALLHELTHIPALVGGFEHWENNRSAKDLAYNPSECIHLPDKDKLNNANNYALFALEVRANTEFARMLVDMGGDARSISESAKHLLTNGSLWN
ncbi:hypothetical protein CTA2_12489, partial [Colletotrichum tanaceti]